SPNGTTPLMMAAQYGLLASVQTLLDEGADVLLKNERGLNALDFALIGSQPDSAVVLKAAILARQRLKRGTW
ncbi:MAG: ankyrin repeat domain-containing protein, partial [Comamonadaceae bacterium]